MKKTAKIELSALEIAFIMEGLKSWDKLPLSIIIKEKGSNVLSELRDKLYNEFRVLEELDK